MFRVGSASDIRQDPVWTSWQDVKSDPFFFPPAANTTEMTVYFDKWEAEMCINYSWGEFKSRTQNTLQELNQKRTSHLSLQLSSDQSVSVHPVLQSLPLMLSNFITNYCVSSVSSNYIVFKCSALMEHLMKHVTRRCLCSQGFCAWEFKLTLAQWRKWKRHTTASGHIHFSLPSSKTAYKKYRVSFVRDVRGGDLHVQAGCLCCQSLEHWHVTWTQTSDQCSSGDASR